MSEKRASGVDNTSRRNWNKSDYEQKAKEREIKDKDAEESAFDIKKRKRLERDPLHQGLIVERANLKARDRQIDLAANLNKTQVVSLTSSLSQQAGYYCSVCDCVLKDSVSYLDHINGKYHNRSLGMSMRVEQSTPDQVRKAIEDAKKQKRQGAAPATDYLPEGLSAQEASKSKAADPGSGEESDDDDEAQEIDPDLAAMMGFGGFAASRK